MNQAEKPGLAEAWEGNVFADSDTRTWHALLSPGRLDAEMDTATRRMSAVLDKLPREINPVNLEELRRVKQALVELESKADQLR